MCVKSVFVCMWSCVNGVFFSTLQTKPNRAYKTFRLTEINYKKKPKIESRNNVCPEHAGDVASGRTTKMRKIGIILVLCGFCVCTVHAQAVVRWVAQPQNQMQADSLVAFDGKPSIRLERNMASIQAVIPATFVGDTLRFKGHIKTSLHAGRAQITLSSYANTRAYGHIFSDIQEVIGQADWQPFELSMPIIEEINFFSPIVAINGDGTVWLADLEITVDGHPFAESGKRKPLTPNYKADIDTLNHSGFDLKNLSGQQIKNLVDACRVWGDIKYNHLAVARGEYNMDSELFRLFPSIVDASSTQCRRILKEWSDRFGVYDKTMRRPIYHYYFGTAFMNGPAMFLHECEYAEMDYTDTGVKLLAVFRLWNAVRYFFPYLEYADDWHEVLPVAIKRVIRSQNREEYMMALRRMASRLNDSHVYIAQNKQDTTLRVAGFFAKKFIDGKYIVTDLPDDQSPLRVGDAITRVGHRTVAEFIKDSSAVYSASNYSQLAKKVGETIYATSTKTPILLTIEGRGDVSVPTYSISDYTPMLRAHFVQTQAEMPFRLLSDSIAYLDIGRLADTNIALSDFDKVIVDMRGYPKGDMSTLISRLLPGTSLISQSISIKPSTPGVFSNHEGDYITGASTKPRRRIILLVDENTISKSEYFCMALQTNPHVYTIGSQTAGANGNTTRMPLPGGVDFSFSGVGMSYPDGRQTQRTGIHIDEKVDSTIESIRNGTDNVLRRAVEILSNN